MSDLQFYIEDNGEYKPIKPYRFNFERGESLKIFISQPMNGIPKEKIREVRAEAAAKIKNKYPEARILESGIDCKPCVPNAELWMLAISLEIMADADMVYFCEGWENARGCRIERECAERYGVRILEL